MRGDGGQSLVYDAEAGQEIFAGLEKSAIWSYSGASLALATSGGWCCSMVGYLSTLPQCGDAKWT